MSERPKFEFEGLDHVALVCRDMVGTGDFYHRKLGMPVLHTLQYFDDTGRLNGQHWFFGVGDPHNPNAHIAMFWWRDGFQMLPKPPQEPVPKGASPHAAPVGKMLHLNLRVAPEGMREYAARLSEEGVSYRHATRYFDPSNPEIMRAVTTFNEYHEPQPKALMNSIYFSDPDGINLEFNCWARE